MKTQTRSRIVKLATLVAVLAVAACQSTTFSGIESEVGPIWQTSASGTGDLAEEGYTSTTAEAESDSTGSKSPVYIGSGH